MHKKIATLVFFCLFFSGNALAFLPKRELRVAVVVAPSFKSIPNWKSEFERRLGYTSRIFESQFKMKFKAVTFADWPSANEKEGTAGLLEDLRGHFPIDQMGNIDLIIGLTRLTDFPDSQSVRDLHTIGQARPFSGYLVLRYPFNRLFKIQEETALTHEMGHLFGAVHTANRNSIMSPVVERQIPTRFDPDNEQIILLTRNMNFREGVNVLKGGTLQILLNSYMKLIQTEQSGDFYYALGIFYLRLGQTDNTLNAWKKALSLEDNAQLHYDIGALYAKLGKPQQAIKELGKAVTAFRSSGQRNNEASALGLLGEAYLAEGNLFAASNALRRAVSLQPGNWEMKTNLALVQIKQGQSQEGLSTLLLALKKDWNNAKILSNIGMAYYQMNQYEDAVNYLNRALRNAGRGADTVSLYGILGSIYMKMGNPAEALKNFNAACERNPSVECHKKLGLMSFQQGLWDNCIRELGAVVQHEKVSEPEVYGALGMAFVKKDDLKNAIAIFNEGIRHTQDNKKIAKFHNSIAQIFTARQQWEPAEKEFQKAVAKDWSNLESHFGLALVYLNRHQLESARASLQHVLQIDSRHSKARELLGRVEDALKAQAGQGTL